MATDSQRARENWDRYVYARDNGHTKFLSKASKCEQYFQGKQWPEEVVRRLEASGRYPLTVNMLLASLGTSMGEQIENTVEVGFKPRKNGTEETAVALSKVWIHIANNNMFQFRRAQVFDDGAISSRGFYDVRLSFDNNLMGEIQIRAKNSKNVIIPPDAEDYDPDTWPEVMVTKWMSPYDIERVYNMPDLAKELQGRREITYDMYDIPRDMFGTEIQSPWALPVDPHLRKFVRVIERQFREVRTIPHFVNPVTGDVRPVPSNWDRERIGIVAQTEGLVIIPRRAEVIHWTTSAGDMYVLHDAQSPYRHFTVVPYFPYFIKGETLGLAEHLISPQDLLNKTTSQELHVINTTANSGYDIEEDQLVNMEPEDLEVRGAETGIVLVRRKGSPPIQKLQPNQVPTGLDRLSFKADEWLKYISGVSDSKRGFDREDVAAKAIKAKQAAGAITLVKPLFNLALTDQLLVRNVVDLVQSYYTEERTLQITGGGLLPETDTLTVNQMTPEGRVVNDLTVGEYEALITTVPARDTYEESQFEEAIRLRELGIAVPDDVIIEHSHLRRKAEIAKRMRDAAGEGEPTQIQQELQQLEVELKKLEAEEKKAQIMKMKAEAGLALMRSKEANARAEQGGGEAELEKLVLEREKMLEDIKLQREKMRNELELKREEMTEMMRIKREEMRQTRALKAQEIKLKAQQAKEKPSATSES